MSTIAKIKELQGERSQGQFAAELGISQSTLSRIYSGRRRLGEKVARRIARRYPALTFNLAAFFLADDIPAEQARISA